MLTIEHTDVEEHGTLYDWVEQISDALSKEIREGMFFINWMLGVTNYEVKGTNMLDPFCSINMVAHLYPLVNYVPYYGFSCCMT